MWLVVDLVFGKLHIQVETRSFGIKKLLFEVAAISAAWLFGLIRLSGRCDRAQFIRR